MNICGALLSRLFKTLKSQMHVCVPLIILAFINFTRMNCVFCAIVWINQVCQHCKWLNPFKKSLCFS